MLLVERRGSTPPGWVHSKTIQLSQQINHVERTQWSWTRALFFFFDFILFYFFFGFSELWQISGGFCGSRRKKMHTATGSWDSVLFFFSLLDFFRSSLCGFRIRVFRSSYLGSFSNVANLTTARLHQEDARRSSRGRPQSGRTPADAFTDKLNFVFADTLPAAPRIAERSIAGIHVFETCRRFPRLPQK